MLTLILQFTKTKMKLFLSGLCIMLALAVTPSQGQTMSEMKQVALHDFEKADAELNSVYKKVFSGLSPKGKAALKESQRAWIIFRDKTAEAYGTCEEGGTNEALMYESCLAAITQNRVKELKLLFLSSYYPY